MFVQPFVILISTMELLDKYPHLQFKRHWEISKESLFLLGQCEAYVKAICNTPILPTHHKKLLNVSLVKGAQATTAIEGNTLTEEDILKIQDGKHVPPSKEYQEIEVTNILEAFNTLLAEVIIDSRSELITSELIKRLHRMVGKSLGRSLDAIPGHFRSDNRIVGTYRCPDHADVEKLVNKFSEWLLEEFHYQKGQQFFEVLIQAIVSHVYLEWIHPFGDGNGRTGRLLEFYILLRGGLPDIASHILSNHYNETRSEYYRQLENATRTKDLTGFIQYALLGLRDGLQIVLEVIQASQFEITWQKFIYDKLSEKNYLKKDTYHRQRDLILSFPVDQALTFEEILLLTPKIAKAYALISERTARRDLQELVELGLLYEEDGRYKANIIQVKGLMALKK